MPIMNDEISKNAFGGTELQKTGLVQRLGPDRLQGVQIFCSRVRMMDMEKKRIFWAHELPFDPEAQLALSNGKWQNFDKIVCVSNWQASLYNFALGVPFEKIKVIENAVYDEVKEKNAKERNVYKIVEYFLTEQKDYLDQQETKKLNAVYTSTPNRGLELLVPAFIELLESDARVRDKIHLHVFSSFKIYGRDHQDEHYQHLFDRCKQFPENITYHGFQNYGVVQDQIKKSHFFLYPCTYTETSCRALMEAMCNGLICIHPNYGALTETSMGLTNSYEYTENAFKHKELFKRKFIESLNVFNEEYKEAREGLEILNLVLTASARTKYGWDRHVNAWNNLLDEINA